MKSLPCINFPPRQSVLNGELRIHCLCCGAPVLLSLSPSFMSKQGFCLDCQNGQFDAKTLKLISSPALPPSNDMGAEFTAPTENRVLVDWLAWTFPTVSDPDLALEMSGLSSLPFSQSGGGGMGYKSSKRCGNIVVYYDGNDNMGCHVSMTGQGCRQFEQFKQGTISWYRLFINLLSVGAKFTRCDIAIDNIDGQLDINTLERCIDNNQIRSRFQSGHIIRKISFAPDTMQPDNKTIYAGSPTSRLKIRFYNKAAQLELSPGQLWTRAELQCMGERAQEAVRLLSKGVEIGHLASSVMNNYFTPINLDDSNRTRCTTQSWWAQWLDNTQKLKLTTCKAIKVISEVVEYVQRQYAPTFAMLKKYMGVVTFHEFMHDLIDQGKERMNKKHEMIIQCSSLITEPPELYPF